jgi:hypothetical protein
MKDEFSLEGKRALITGAGRGTNRRSAFDARIKAEVLVDIPSTRVRLATPDVLRPRPAARVRPRPRRCRTAGGAELAEALLGLGDLDRAEHEAQASVTAAHAQHSRCYELSANLALAHIQLRRADGQALARVEQALVRAQELIAETGAQGYQPEVHECRAHLAQLCGDASAARRELDAARRLYDEMGATAQVERLAKEMVGSERQALLDQPRAKS